MSDVKVTREREAWVRLPGFPLYEVSDLGNVRSWVPRPWNGPKPERARELVPGKDNNGYRQVYVSNGVDKGTRRVCRLVLIAFRGAQPGLLALHNNGNNRDDRLENLRWGTKSDNAHDAVRHGTLPTGDRHSSRLRPEIIARGEAVGTAKLTTSDVSQIRAQRGFLPHWHLAEIFGVSRAAISQVMSGSRWSHIAYACDHKYTRAVFGAGR